MRASAGKIVMRSRQARQQQKPKKAFKKFGVKDILDFDLPVPPRHFFILNISVFHSLEAHKVRRQPKECKWKVSVCGKDFEGLFFSEQKCNPFGLDLRSVSVMLFGFRHEIITVRASGAEEKEWSMMHETNNSFHSLLLPLSSPQAQR